MSSKTGSAGSSGAATLTVMRSAATACHFLSVPEWGGLCCCWEVGL